MGRDAVPLCVYCIAEAPYQDEQGAFSMPLGAGYLAVEPLLDAHRFEETDSAERMSWLMTRAERHHRVNETVSACGACLPVRFGIVIRSEEDALSAVGHLLPELPRLFDAMRGKQEWGVKVTIPRSNLSRNGAVERQRRLSGAEYLREREKALADASQGRTYLREVADTCHHACSTESANAVRSNAMIPPQGDVLVLAGAYLVESDHVESFLGVVQRLRARFLLFNIHVNGPWPPYDFVATDDCRKAEVLQ